MASRPNTDTELQNREKRTDSLSFGEGWRLSERSALKIRSTFFNWRKSLSSVAYRTGQLMSARFRTRRGLAMAPQSKLSSRRCVQAYQLLSAMIAVCFTGSLIRLLGKGHQISRGITPPNILHILGKEQGGATGSCCANDSCASHRRQLLSCVNLARKKIRPSCLSFGGFRFQQASRARKIYPRSWTVEKGVLRLAFNSMRIL